MPFIRNPKDFYAGLLFMAFGLAALVLAQDYSPGTASRMGPGYFPRILGVLLLGLGVILSLGSLRSSAEPRIVWRWKPLVIVLFSITVFAMLAEWLGLVATALLLAFVSSAASAEFRWKEALLSGAILGIAAVAVFVYGLGIPLPVWPAFIGGGA